MTENRYRLIHTKGDGQDVFRKAEKFNAHADVYVYPAGESRTSQSHTDMAAVSLTVTPDGAWTVTTRPAFREGTDRPEEAVAAAGHVDAANDYQAVCVAVPQMNNGHPTVVVFAVPYPAFQANLGKPWTYDQAAAVAVSPPTVVCPDEFPGRLYSHDQMADAISKAGDDITESGGLGASDAEAAMNVALNAAMTYLDDPDADLHDVVERCYDGAYPRILADLNPELHPNSGQAEETPRCEGCGHADGETDTHGTRVAIDPKLGLCSGCIAYNLSRN